MFGGVLLSHTLAGAVPSALEGLASGFGMGPGVPHSATTTDNTIQPNKQARPRRGGLCAQGHTVDASNNNNKKDVVGKPSAY